MKEVVGVDVVDDVVLVDGFINRVVVDFVVGDVVVAAAGFAFGAICTRFRSR
jgi:hypothetical protein